MTDSAANKCAGEDAQAIAEEESHGRVTAPLNLQLIPWRHTKVIPISILFLSLRQDLHALVYLPSSAMQ